MESPVFKLEKVVHSRSEEMQDFEGPLDLILFLLGKNKLEIQDISISLICGQYIAWLEDRQRMDLEVASEFVIMASHLVYLKTRMLLSIEDDEAKSEMDALLQSLEERRRSENYVRVKALAQRLAPMGEFGRNIVTRNPEPVKRGKVFEYSHQPADLVLAMAEIQSRAERKLPPPRASFREIVQHEPYPVESKARDILQKLKEGGITRFLLLFRGSRSRSRRLGGHVSIVCGVGLSGIGLRSLDDLGGFGGLGGAHGHTGRRLSTIARRLQGGEQLGLAHGRRAAQAHLFSELFELRQLHILKILAICHWLPFPYRTDPCLSRR